MFFPASRVMALGFSLVDERRSSRPPARTCVHTHAHTAFSLLVPMLSVQGSWAEGTVAGMSTPRCSQVWCGDHRKTWGLSLGGEGPDRIVSVCISMCHPRVGSPWTRAGLCLGHAGVPVRHVSGKGGVAFLHPMTLTETGPLTGRPSTLCNPLSPAGQRTPR